MILAAIRAKLDQRGSIGFAADVVELSAACAIIGVQAAVMFSAALAGGLIAAPLLAWEALTCAGEMAEYRERP